MSVVKFIRIRGRIVPIFDKARQGIKKVVGAAKSEASRVGRGVTTESGAAVAVYGVPFLLVSNTIGASIGASAAKKDSERLIKEMKSGRDVVDAKKAAKVMKNVTIITDAKDSDNAFKKEDERFKMMMRHVATEGTKNNAFALRYKEKDYVITQRRVSRTVLGHELGHIEDYRRNGTAGIGEIMFGRITGATVRRERRAWELSPFKGKERKGMRESAIGTYEKTTRGAQIGTAAGAGAIWAVLRKLGRM